MQSPFEHVASFSWQADGGRVGGGTSIGEKKDFVIVWVIVCFGAEKEINSPMTT